MSAAVIPFAPTIKDLPHNYEAEQAFLGACLANNGVFFQADEFLRPEHFADPLHGRIYEAIGAIVGRGQVANPVTLKNQFDQDGALAEIGGAEYLVKLASCVVSVIGARDYAEAVLDLFVRRQIILTAAEFAAWARAHDPNDAAEGGQRLVERFEARLAEIGEQAQQTKAAHTIAQVAQDALAMFEKAYQADGALTGVTTGLRDLDERTGGLQPGLIILAGRPSMGKTTGAMNIAKAAAKRSLERLRAGEKPMVDGKQVPGLGWVAFFSFEMGSHQIGQKFLAMESDISTDTQGRGKLFNSAGKAVPFETMIEAANAYSDLPIVVDDHTMPVPQAIAARCRRIQRRHGLALVVIDYLQLMQAGFGRHTENRVQEVSEITRALHRLSQELSVPVLALSQLNRALETREDKRPQLADLRESGSIEQDATVVIFAYREEYYLERSEPKQRANESLDKFSERVNAWSQAMQRSRNILEYIIAKNRMGRVGTVEAWFDGHAGRVVNLGGFRGDDGPGGAPDGALDSRAGGPPDSYPPGYGGG